MPRADLEHSTVGERCGYDAMTGHPGVLDLEQRDHDDRVMVYAVHKVLPVTIFVVACACGVERKRTRTREAPRPAVVDRFRRIGERTRRHPDRRLAWLRPAELPRWDWRRLEHGRQRGFRRSAVGRR